MGMVLPLLAGCRLDGLVFVQDDAIVITSPANLATVREPVQLSWTATTSAATFAVFVDTVPMDVGEKIDRNLPQDQALETSTTSVRLSNLRPGQGATDQERNHHEATVVIVDSEGRRQGEQFASVEFTVRP